MYPCAEHEDISKSAIYSTAYVRFITFIFVKYCKNFKYIETFRVDLVQQ